MEAPNTGATSGYTRRLSTLDRNSGDVSLVEGVDVNPPQRAPVEFSPTGSSSRYECHRSYGMQY
jgi:hypothetical protein